MVEVKAFRAEFAKTTQVNFSPQPQCLFLCPSPLPFGGSTVLETYSSTTSRSRPRTRGELIRGYLSMHGPETGIIPLRDEIAFTPTTMPIAVDFEHPEGGDRWQ